MHKVNIRIKKSILKAQDDGESFYNKLEAKEPIGVSTGLFTVVEQVNGQTDSGEEYQGIATNQEYNHLAMLPDSEPPAGGEATFMRFNSADMASSMVVNIDDYATNSKGLDFSEGHRAVMQKLQDKMEFAVSAKVGTDKHIYVSDWNEDTIIYYRDGEQYSIGYTNQDDSVSLVGEPQKVVEKPAYEPLFNKILNALGLAKFASQNSSGYNISDNQTKEDLTMAQADVLAEVFGINKDELNGLSDAEFKAKLNSLGNTDQGDLVKTINALNEKVDSLSTKLNEKSNKEREDKIDALVNKDVGLEKEDLEKLEDAAINKLFVKHCSKTNSVNASTKDEPETNSLADDEMPSVEV